MVALLTIANASAFVDRYVLGLLVGPLRRDLAISDVQISLLMGLPFAIFYTALGLPIGRLADRTSRRAIIAWSVAAWSVMTMLCGAARSFGALLAARIGVSVGEAGLTPPAYSMISDAFPPERLSTAMSVFSIGIFLGAGIANVFGGAVVLMAGTDLAWTLPLVGALKPWQAIFVMVGAPGLVIALLMRTVPEPPRHAPVGATPETDRTELRTFLRAHWKTLGTVTLAVSFFAAVNTGVAGWLPTFFNRTYGWTAAEAGLVAGLLTMTVGVAGAVFSGWWADRLRARGVADANLVVFIVGSVAMGVLAAIFPLMPTGRSAAAVLALVNFPAAFPFGVAAAAIAEVTPNRLRAQVSALFLFVLSLVGSSLGPTAVAVLTDYAFHDDASLRYSLSIVAAAGHVCATACMVGARRGYRAMRAQQGPLAIFPPETMNPRFPDGY